MARMNKIRVGSDCSGVEWKPISGYEGYYEVSSAGDIKSVRREIKNKLIGTFFRNEKLIKPQNRNGYYKIGLSKKGKYKQYSVHRIVAKAFIPNPKNKKEVNHINGIRNDNRVENLEWCSRKENAIHSYQTGLQISQKGSVHGKSKLTEKDVLNIKIKSKQGIRNKDLSIQYNCSPATISGITKGYRWTHVKLK